MANHALMKATVAVKVPASTVRWEFVEHQYAVTTMPATMNAEVPTRRTDRWYTTAFDGWARYSSAIHGMREIAPPPYTRSRRRLERSAGALRSRLVSYTHLRAHETGRNLVCRLL